MSDWPSLRRPIEATKQLLVEGRTPEIFFREWIEALGLKSYVEVRDFRSIGDLTDFLKVFTSLKQFREGVTSLGIVRDAEQSSAASAFDSVCSSLKEVGLSCPDGIGKFSEATPRTGSLFCLIVRDEGCSKRFAGWSWRAIPETVNGWSVLRVT